MTAAVATQPVLADQQVILPGVYDMSADVYHSDPVPGGSLSRSGARDLLKTCPARYRYDRDNAVTRTTKTFDHGKAAHRLVLGAGPDIVRIDRDRWDTNAVKAEVAAVRQKGGIPLKVKDFEMVTAMAAALREHPAASALFAGGRPERALFWQDKATGVWLRSMLDWLPDPPPPGQRMIVPEYKSCESAAPADLPKVIHNLGYHMQADWYLTGLRALGLADQHARFVFVLQEKTPPYLVTVAQPDDWAVLRIAREENRRAINLYAECVATGRWPGYSDEIELISLPPWVQNEYERRHS